MALTFRGEILSRTLASARARISAGAILAGALWTSGLWTSGLWGSGLWASGLWACGGSRATAAAPEPEHEQQPPAESGGAEPGAVSEPAAVVAAPAESAEPAPGAHRVPSECARAGDLCLPPPAFVKRLCQDAYTGAALRLFEKSSPFSRGYIQSREIKAVNTLGGPASDAPLRFDEEVLILTRRGGGGPGEMQVSGMGGYDVLRWDGTCATLSDGELTLRAPKQPRHAQFAWQDLDTNIQAALLRDAAIATARRNHKKHCHGVSLGQRSAACASAEDTLGARIALSVRTGIELPTPDRMP
jgi:hypothetical protein